MEDSLLEALEELKKAELKQFIWHLSKGVTPDVKPISRGKLEEADRQDVVDCMVQNYSADAGKIAIQALRNIKQNDLANCLELKFQEGQQPVQEEARSVPESVELQPIQADWCRPHNITACSQEFKNRLLTLERSDVYMPTSRSTKKGLALLITNITFDHLKYRRGAEKDEENMEWLLTALGYSVEKHTDLSGEEIDEKVKNFATRPEHQDSDSTFVVIMSHGNRINNRDAILGVHCHDDNPDDVYFVDKTFSHLNSESCPALIDKPKVILIQACRGGLRGGVFVCDHVPESDSCQHREKNFVCFMSTLPDVESYRNPKNGCFFIMYIVDVLSACAHNDDIMELFRKVTSHMENDPRFINHKKLLPCIERTTLVKKFYLFPGL